jgi:putative membrane protein
VELVRNLFQRGTGLVEVRIETASGTEVEGLLSALTVPEAEGLRQELVSLRDASTPDEDPEARVLLRNTLRDLLIYGTTAGRLGAAAVIVGIVIEAVTWATPERLGDLPAAMLGLGGVAGVVAVLAGAWLLGVGGAVVRHWGFTLSQREGALIVESGLTTTRRLELPLNKVQLVMTSEPLLRRWLGVGSLTIESAAARSGEGGTERRAAMAPLVPRDELPGLARIAIPDLDVDPWNVELHPPHPRALARAIGRRVVQVVLVTSVLAWLWSPWVLLGLLLALPLAATAWLDWRYQGWRITQRTIIARRGFFDRRMVLVSRRKLQSVSADQGLLLRRLGLGRVVVLAAGSRVSLPLIGWDQALALVSDLATPPAPPAPRIAPAEPPEPESP